MRNITLKHGRLAYTCCGAAAPPTKKNKLSFQFYIQKIKNEKILNPFCSIVVKKKHKKYKKKKLKRIMRSILIM